MGEKKYLKLDLSGFFGIVHGDGTEGGFIIEYDHWDPKKPKVTIPEADNLCGAKLVSIGTKPANDRTKFMITISTEVWGDGGGCIVWLQNKDNDKTMGVALYEYLIDKP